MVEIVELLIEWIINQSTIIPILVFYCNLAETSKLKFPHNKFDEFQINSDKWLIWFAFAMSSGPVGGKFHFNYEKLSAAIRGNCKLHVHVTWLTFSIYEQFTIFSKASNKCNLNKTWQTLWVHLRLCVGFRGRSVKFFWAFAKVYSSLLQLVVCAKSLTSWIFDGWFNRLFYFAYKLI